jgi:5-methyltetrahydropteroyltriglutamate--homocysteine methyltransferase
MLRTPTMQRSMQRILTTHCGSLPRPDDLLDMLMAREQGRLPDMQAFHARVRQAVGECVRKQRDTGLDIVNDGEWRKPDYSTHVKNRFTGFEGEPTPTDVGRDILDFSEYAPYRRTGLQLLLRPKCNGPIAWKYFDAVRRENVVAGVDCGCATFAGAPTVLPTIAWAKVGALAEGARIASKKLWARPT